MSDKLKQAFEIYMRENMLGVDADHILDFLNNNGYELGSKRRDEAIDAYMKVTNDPVLSTLISELSSYDLNNPGTDIRTLYDTKKREMDLEKKEELVEASKEVKEEVKATEEIIPQIQPNQTTEQKVAMTESVLVQEPTLEPSVLLPQSGELTKAVAHKKALKLTNPDTNKLNQIGYANVVLMSIIVIIIVAIICVFILA